MQKNTESLDRVISDEVKIRFGFNFMYFMIRSNAR